MSFATIGPLTMTSSHGRRSSGAPVRVLRAAEMGGQAREASRIHPIERAARTSWYVGEVPNLNVSIDKVEKL